MIPCCDNPTCISSLTPPYTNLTCGSCNKSCIACTDKPIDYPAIIDAAYTRWKGDPKDTMLVALVIRLMLMETISQGRKE